jgi:lysophospholipase L1-like esterase
MVSEAPSASNRGQTRRGGPARPWQSFKRSEAMFSGFPVQDGETILFIGDSITDCGRRATERPYGSGYVSFIVEMVTAIYPDRRIVFINKGIGGNRVTDLRDRWEDDVTPFKPDWLSVKIGINDLHSHLRKVENPVSPQVFRQVYDEVLDRTMRQQPPRLVLIDPFYISRDTSGRSFRSEVMAILPEYIQVVTDMARKYGALRVRTHDMFQRLIEHHPADTFCPEPVHPNRAGHLAIAAEFMRVLCAAGKRAKKSGGPQ